MGEGTNDGDYAVADIEKCFVLSAPFLGQKSFSPPPDRSSLNKNRTSPPDSAVPSPKDLFTFFTFVMYFVFLRWINQQVLVSVLLHFYLLEKKKNQIAN